MNTGSYAQRKSPVKILLIATVVGLLIGLLFLGVLSLLATLKISMTLGIISILAPTLVALVIAVIVCVLSSEPEPDEGLDFSDELISEMHSLKKLVDESELRISALEREMVSHLNGLAGDDAKPLHLARRIVNAISMRLEEIKILFAAGAVTDKHVTQERLNRDLDLDQGTLHTVLGAEVVTSLARSEWETEISSLLSKAEEAIRKVA